MTHRFNVNFSDDAWGVVDEFAQELGISRGEVLRDALSLYKAVGDDVRVNTIHMRLRNGEALPHQMYFPMLEKLRPATSFTGGAGLGQRFVTWLRNRHSLAIASTPL